MLLLVLVIGLAIGQGGARAQSETTHDHAALVRNILDTHTVPRFAALKDKAAMLPGSVAALCREGGDEARGRAREAFRDTAAAFAQVDFFRFGPLAEKGRRERFAFWPDPRGAVARQMRTLITSNDAALLEPGAMARQSAAVQGLPALEMLLADKELPLATVQAASFRCGLAAAIAENLAVLAQEMSDAWIAPGGIRQNMLDAGPGNALYKSHAEAAGELLKSLLTGLQVVADLHLKPRVDAKPGAPPKGPYARLGLEPDVYAAAVQSLRALYDLLGLEGHIPASKAWMKDWARGAWRAMKMSDGMGGPGEGVSAAEAPKLKEVASRIGGLRMLIGKEMSNAAGIAIGFNELDGD